VSEPNDEGKKQRAWKSLQDAGLVEIAMEEFPERISEAKRTVIGRLNELMQAQNRMEERQSLAHSLGALKNLETTLRSDVSSSRKK
jgi:hypothetical protein